MAALSRLLRVGSMTDAVGVYAGAMIVQKTVGLGRLVLLAYLMSRVPGQYGMWGLGLMVVALAAPVLSLGVSHGLRRYVSHYEARGQLGAFYKRVRWFVPVTCIATGCVALVCSGPLTRGLILSRAPVDLPYADQLALCIAALANAAVMSVHQCVVGFMAGMRAYRLVSAVEVFFSVLFTVLAAVAVWLWPTGLAVLWAHLAALLVTLTIAVVLLGVLVARSAARGAAAPGGPPGPGMLRRLVRFALGATAAGLCLAAAQSVSLFIVNRWEGKAPAGVYALFAQLSQPMFFLACAAWAVILTHSARRWEGGDPDGAMRSVQTGYKAVAVATMTLAVAVLAAAPLWVCVLPSSFRRGGALLGGLLMFFQSLTHLAVMTIAARLHERPGAVAMPMLVGGALNAVLAFWWLGAWGPAGAAWAAGVGMYVGGGAAAVGYLLVTRSRLGASTYVVMSAPVLLALAVGGALWAPAAAWAVVLGVALATDRLFSAEEKRVLADSLRRLLGSRR